MRNKKRILALLLAGVLAFGGLPITASAANNVRDGARPANGTTVSQPFPEKLFLGEHNSTNGYTRFRIPALTTAAMAHWWQRQISAGINAAMAAD